MSNQKPTPGTDGKQYIPQQDRSGPEAVVYFTKDLSPEGLRRITARVLGNLTGKVGVKLHTGEPHGPNIIPHHWIQHLIQTELHNRTTPRDLEGQRLDLLPCGHPGRGRHRDAPGEGRQVVLGDVHGEEFAEL